MSYNVKEVTKKISEEIKKERFSLETFAEMAGTSRQTLSNWLKSDMPLSKFLEICSLLKLNPSTFFLENHGVIQNATNSSNVNVNQNVGTGAELELLRQDNKRLAEQIELYKKLLESYQK